MLEVRLIGRFDIRFNGAPIRLSARAAQSLLSFLILTAGTEHRREKLAGMFWPDAPEDKARAYLRYELWRIRKVFSSHTGSEYLLSDDIVVSFNPSADYCLDVDTLRNLDDHTSAGELMNGLSAYQGEFLPGFYDEWIMDEREQLQLLYEKRIGQLLPLLKEENRWHEVLEWSEIWLSHTRFSEAAYQYLMLAYDALGEPAKVAATYERCVNALHELDQKPSEKSRALAFKHSPSLYLPLQLTSFIGRENELQEVEGLLKKFRLVTLTGSGGVGKTRLAVQVATEVMEQFPDGVWFLDLAPLTDPALVSYALANLLGLRDSDDEHLTKVLLNYFHNRTTLLIFDNCEHLVDACAQLVSLLMVSCKNLFMLATSREALRVAGEVSYRVPSLTVPNLALVAAPETFASFEAVQLFEERARVALPGFVLNPQSVSTVAKICHRLDGIPLAIELAASRLNMLTPEEVLERLENRFNLLTVGMRSAVPRHQTLRSTIAWSYDLLSEQERTLFRRLAVFSGGWTLEAAEAVCGQSGLRRNEILDLLCMLVNKSLILVDRTAMESWTRYRMLETIREYAMEVLNQSGEWETIKLSHLSFFVEMVEKAEGNFRGPQEASWYARLDSDLDNLRTALTSFEKFEYSEKRLHLASSLWRYWKSRGKSREGRLYLQRILNSLPPGPFQESEPFAKALNAAGALAYYEGDFFYSEQARRDALDVYRKLGDRVGIANCLNGLGNTALTQGNYTTAREYYEEGLSLRRELGDKWGVARLLGNLGLLAYFEAQYTDAYSLHVESVDLFRELKDGESIANELVNLGDVVLHQGDILTALSLYEEGAMYSRELKDQWGLAYALLGMAEVAMLQRNYTKAASLYSDCLNTFQRTADNIGLPFALESIAAFAIVRDQLEKAVRIYGAADVLRTTNHTPLPLPNQPAYRKNRALLQETLGLSKFNFAWTEGCKLTTEQAVSLALTCVAEN